MQKLKMAELRERGQEHIALLVAVLVFSEYLVDEHLSKNKNYNLLCRWYM